MRSSWRRRRLGTALVLLAVVGPACDSGTPDVAVPELVETCDELVDVGDQLVRAYALVLEQTDVGDLTAATPDDNLDELAGIGQELDARAVRLGCDFAELNAAIVASTADLEPTSPSVEMLLSVVRDGVVGQPPAAPVTTTGGSDS